MWISACIFDVNYPPGARIVRLLTVLVLCLLGLAEVGRPWFGFSALFIAWPQGLVLRETLERYAAHAFVSMTDRLS